MPDDNALKISAPRCRTSRQMAARWLPAVVLTASCGAPVEEAAILGDMREIMAGLNACAQRCGGFPDDLQHLQPAVAQDLGGCSAGDLLETPGLIRDVTGRVRGRFRNYQWMYKPTELIPAVAGKAKLYRSYFLSVTYEGPDAAERRSFLATPDSTIRWRRGGSATTSDPSLDEPGGGTAGEREKPSTTR